MNFRLQDSPRKIRTDIVLADRKSHEVFTDKIRYIFLELPAFNKQENECENDFERWIYVLKNMETLQRLPFKARKAVFNKLEEIVDIASLSKEERMKYDESIKVYRDNLAIMAFEREQGMKEGFKKGRREGREEGEKIKAREIARLLKQTSFPVSNIAQCTGLSENDIAEL